MSAGRGRGYGGRHAARETRPGEVPDHPAPRMMAELIARPTEDTNEREERHEPHKMESQLSSDEEAVMKELLTVDDQYAPLLVLLEQFSPGEDGIAFNRKLRHFESSITAMCPDEAQLQQAFATFRAAALRRASVSRRLATVGACFTRQPRQQPLRAALLNQVMQGTYTKLEVLERANPTFLVNAANLMGDYFAEARLCNGNKVHILAAPLLQYLRALLASHELRAHRSLATQLMQNGRELLSVMPIELDDLSISIRQRLLSPPPVSIVWLLLSADICLNKFLPLPVTLQQFYAAQLEFTADDSNYSEVSYGSWKNPDKNDVEKVGLNVSQLNLSHEEDGKPRLRPILGAGAGLLRQEQAPDTFDSSLPKYEFPVKIEYGNDFNVNKSSGNDFTKSSLSKRYDLNSWRQNNEEASVVNEEPVFNPNILPPNLQSSTNIDYLQNTQSKENHRNYLQQGDGVFITIQQNLPNEYTPPDCEKHEETNREREIHFNRPTRDKIDNELQKNRRHSDRDEVSDTRVNTKIRSRQRSSDAGSDEREPRDDSKSSQRERSNRRNSTESSASSRAGKPVPRRHVSEVPRSQAYWDHDDRCDRDYVS